MRVMGDAVAQLPGLELFQTITVPVLLLMADRGYSTAGEHGAQQRERVDGVASAHANVTVEWLDAGHLIHWERPDEVAARVTAFAHAVT